MASLALTFDILAKDVNASKTFRDVGNSAERAGRQTETAGSAITRSMKTAGAAIVAAGLGTMFVGFVKDAAESARISRLTEAAIKSTGGAAHVTAGQVSGLAEAISAKTGADDEMIQGASNVLLTFTRIRNETGKGNDIFNQATQAALDMSVAMGTDANGAAMQLGKALNDPIAGMSALGRAGVQFTAQQKDQIATLVESGDTLSAQKIILGELSTQFGGAAEAASDPMQRLATVAENLGEEVGARLLPYVEDFAQFATDHLIPAAGAAFDVFDFGAGVIGAVVGVLEDLPGPVLAGAAALAAVALLKGPVSSAFDTMALKAIGMLDPFTKASGVMGGIKAAGSGIASFFGGPWGLAVAGAGAAVGLLTSAVQASEDQTRDWAAALREGGAAARVAREEMELHRARIDELSSGFKGATIEVSGMSGWLGIFADDADAAEQSTRDLWSQMDPLAQAQAKVSEWTSTLSTRLETLGADHEDTRTAQERLAYWTELLAGRQEALDTAVAGTSATTGTFADRISAARDELDTAKQAVDDFKLALDLLSGNTVSMIQVESAFQNAIAQADGAMDELGGAALNASGSLNLQSENGRKAADVLLDVRNSGNDLIATMIQQGATTEDVAAKDAELRDSFIRTAGQMGITGGNAETLADQILGIPGSRNTVITADARQATGVVSNFQGLLASLKDRIVNITARANLPAIPGVQRMGTYAGGGYTGGGGKFEPAGIVHRREFVFPSEAVDRIGVPTLAAMAGLPGYAVGGLVTPPGLTVRPGQDARSGQPVVVEVRNYFNGQELVGMVDSRIEVREADQARRMRSWQ